MFASRDQLSGGAGVVEVAFTDRHGGVSSPPFDTFDLSRSRPGRDAELEENHSQLRRQFGVDRLVSMRQVHGSDVVPVGEVPPTEPPECDALVTESAGVGLCVRVGDCVPVLLADADAGVVGVAHAGRPGVVAGVVPATIEAMRRRGAETVTAWVGPHVCGGCYEVPAQMRDEVASADPAAFACTTWGTPSVDIGAAVRAQLERGGCRVIDRSVCTLESGDFYSYRRDGADSGRFAGVVVLRGATDG